MKNIEIYNTLNIDKDSSSIVATFTQEDDAVMEFKLFKDGQEIVLKDQTISLGAERKDGAVIEQDDGFLIKENNVLNITLKKNIIQVVGVVKIQLYLKDKSGEMASNTFNIRVNKKLLGAENVEATNDIKSLNTLVLELKNNTNKLIDDTKSKADKLLNDLQETGDNLSSTVKAKTDKIIEDTKAEVNNIKKDYEGLKKVVIDENIGIKLQKDVTELQNGLKSNQALAYQGSSISANDTLEGRTEGM
ncbi:TPA: BppU family phage baseplate upper protein, partial [Clostridium perfringens]|nr:BppU family phage baseplate upper protein [Clostridium perfringens]